MKINSINSNTSFQAKLVLPSKYFISDGIKMMEPTSKQLTQLKEACDKIGSPKDIVQLICPNPTGEQPHLVVKYEIGTLKGRNFGINPTFENFMNYISALQTRFKP